MPLADSSSVRGGPLRRCDGLSKGPEAVPQRELVRDTMIAEEGCSVSLPAAGRGSLFHPLCCSCLYGSIGDM